MKPYTYLFIDFLTVIVCFIASFHEKVKFYLHFIAFTKAAIIVAIPFIIWDIWFTKTGVWWFNKNYTMGASIFELPLEEWLFFFCIPFACTFTYFSLDKIFNLNWANKYNKYLVWFFIAICMVTAVIFADKMYPLVTSLITIFTVFFLRFIAKVEWIGKATLDFLILLPGFFIVNGLLTGTGLEAPIVNYNSNEILNLRFFTIPVEDAFFGYSQFMLIVYFFNKFKKKQTNMKNYKKITSLTMFIGLFTILNSCSTIPKKAKVVKNFELNRYLGTWHEIARFDFRFERNLDNTTAQYSLNKKGNVIVLNSGRNYKTNKWRSAKGLAKFRKDKNSAALKVSFFGPFYASYNVIALDSDYRYALIAGKNLDYLWILSRDKTIPDNIKKNYLEIAQNVGFDTSKLIWVKHDKNNPFVGEK